MSPVGGNHVWCVIHAQAKALGLTADSGRSIYVRIWSLTNGQWLYNEYIYRATGGSSSNQLDVIAAPVNQEPLLESLLIPLKSWKE